MIHNDPVRFFQQNHQAEEILQEVYSELKNGRISSSLSKKVKMFYENHVEYEKQTRKAAGCGWYTDAEGKVRTIATDELEDDFFERSIKK
jgi:hypothetical protein